MTLAVILVGLCVAIYPYLPLPVYSVNYHGTTLNFRVNLKEAKNTPVYPDELAVQREIMNQFVENITIVFKPGSGQENAHYAIETFEVVNKLATVFLKAGYMPKFNVVNVTSYDNLSGKIQNPMIALVHPVYSNETSVRLVNHTIYISGKNATSEKEQLRNFDLATVKFIMVALGIELSS